MEFLEHEFVELYFSLECRSTSLKEELQLEYGLPWVFLCPDRTVWLKLILTHSLTSMIPALRDLSISFLLVSVWTLHRDRKHPIQVLISRSVSMDDNSFSISSELYIVHLNFNMIVGKRWRVDLLYSPTFKSAHFNLTSTSITNLLHLVFAMHPQSSCIALSHWCSPSCCSCLYIIMYMCMKLNTKHEVAIM